MAKLKKNLKKLKGSNMVVCSECGRLHEKKGPHFSKPLSLPKEFQKRMGMKGIEYKK
jgi:hypothetical protein